MAAAAGVVALVAIPAAIMIGGDEADQPTVGEIPAPSQQATPVAIQAPEAVDANPASSPTEAVEQFLAAETQRDLRSSLALLSDSERATIGSVEAWALRHDQMPRIVRYRLIETSGPTVAVSLQLEPRLDEVNGYTPAQATAMFSTVAVAGGHLVDFAATTLDPVLPPDSDAAAVAREWVEARQQCTTEAQYAGSLLGQPDAADALCGVSGTFSAGAPGPLADFVDPGVVHSAFGPDASQFTRVIRLSGPIPLDVVTAPEGDRWVVVAVATG